GRDASARGIAVVMMVMTLGSALSPAVGAWITEGLGWRPIFLLLAVVGAAVLAWTVRRLGETRAEPLPLNTAEISRTYGLFLRSRPFMCFALCTSFTSASWFTFIANAPGLMSETLHEPPSTYGLMIIMPMLTYMLGNGMATRLALRLGANAMIMLGVALSLVSGTAMAVWCVYPGLSSWALFLPMALSSVGNGLSQPSAMASGLSIYPRVAGTASGFIGFLQMAISALGTLVVGFLPHDGAAAMVAVVLATQVLAVVLGMVAVRRPAGGLATPAPA
ncbi:MAG TPA: MFS transporter, partial [Stellaceae bacterium]|nr:MFS transporter [Stellaceae bacterium]